LPYAGYFVWLVAPSAGLPPESTFTFYFWVGLPAMLFDRALGVAAFAPWLFIAAAGVATVLRADRARLLPAAATIAASLAVLSLFRYWEGGYAPPGRYLLDVLPLARRSSPMASHGCDKRRCAPSALALIALGVVATLAYAAVPTTALNTAFDDKLQEILDAIFGASPIGWLPSFQPTTPDWYVAGTRALCQRSSALPRSRGSASAQGRVRDAPFRPLCRCATRSRSRGRSSRSRAPGSRTSRKTHSESSSSGRYYSRSLPRPPSLRSWRRRCRRGVATPFCVGTSRSTS